MMLGQILVFLKSNIGCLQHSVSRRLFYNIFIDYCKNQFEEQMLSNRTQGKYRDDSMNGVAVMGMLWLVATATMASMKR
jgi:hypothetical protein